MIHSDQGKNTRRRSFQIGGRRVIQTGVDSSAQQPTYWRHFNQAYQASVTPVARMPDRNPSTP